MNTIHKYPISLVHSQSTVDLPQNFTPLFVGLDPSGQLCLWVQCELAAPLMKATVFVVGTGQPVPASAVRYVGSVVAGNYVWHVYLMARVQIG